MFILVMRFVIRIPWAHSLKDKRKVKRSLVDSMRNRYNVSAKEVEAQEAQQTLVIGLSYTALSQSDAENMIETFTDYVYENSEGEVSLVEQEIFTFYN
ncbi:MAG: DUF503 domain-containing protein [Eubacteriales bacterium]|nr:DUF503 domain-containing protein [Eubacteriales bacterium]MDD4323338.1 DUF503 domain-containing protein [Eubacteriales bacterium]MDD4540635.1 DUF503 domain-containing protein [Eubacteriales bacterium]